MDFLVITDLDNTLLNENYSFEAAIPVIERLKSLSVPIIFATSKTLAETLYFQKLMGISCPFVVENGGAGYIPKNFFLRSGREPFFDGEYYEMPLGVPFEELLGFMQDFSSRHKVRFSYLHDMAYEDISRITGLPHDLAKLARRRDWDVAFLSENASIIPVLEKEAEEKGLKLQKGGIFYHITGDHTKADALRKLLKESGLENSLIIALGDSPNDLEMLKMANIPVLLSADKDRASKFKKEIPRLRIYREKASQGWAKAVGEILKEIEGGE